MQRLALGTASLLAIAIIGIGTQWVANPRAAARIFGLPLPEEGEHTTWFLRLKGVRDIVSGLVVFAFMAAGGPRAVGIVLLVEAITPIGDMSMVLAGQGSAKRALGIHGVTAAVMILTAIPLVSKAP